MRRFLKPSKLLVLTFGIIPTSIYLLELTNETNFPTHFSIPHIQQKWSKVLSMFIHSLLLHLPFSFRSIHSRGVFNPSVSVGFLTLYSVETVLWRLPPVSRLCPVLFLCLYYNRTFRGIHIAFFLKHFLLLDSVTQLLFVSFSSLWFLTQNKWWSTLTLSLGPPFLLFIFSSQAVSYV